MSTITDTDLTAYIDDEATPDEARRLEERISREPGAIRRLLDLVRADKVATAYFTSIDDRPLPAGIEAVLARFDEPIAADGGHGGDNVVALPHRPRPFRARHMLTAASVALLIGVGVGAMLRGAPGGAPETGGGLQRIAADQPLYGVLERAPSGETLALDGGERGFATALSTFRSSDGSYCREYELSDPEALSQGIACRQSGGGWSVRALLTEPTASDDGMFRTASEDRPALLVGAKDSLAAGAPLTADDELALIESSWGAADY